MAIINTPYPYHISPPTEDTFLHPRKKVPKKKSRRQHFPLFAPKKVVETVKKRGKQPPPPLLFIRGHFQEKNLGFFAWIVHSTKRQGCLLAPPLLSRNMGSLLIVEGRKEGRGKGRLIYAPLCAKNRHHFLAIGGGGFLRESCPTHKN